MEQAGHRAKQSDNPHNEQRGIAHFVAKSKNILALMGFMQKPENGISARAYAFKLAMDSALSRMPPDLEAIARAPAWLALSVEEQIQLILTIGTLVHAPSLAVSLNGALLHDIAARIGEVKLDLILHTVDTNRTNDQPELALNQLEADGQSILLATLAPTLRLPLMEGIYFRLANANMIEKWQPHAKALLSKAEDL